MTYPDQVGGSHYKAEIQHWDLMEEFKVPYLDATSSKYVTRWRKKEGAKDLRKAASYLERILVEGRGAVVLIPEDRLEAFFEANKLDHWDRALIRLIHLDGSVTAFGSAAAILREKADNEDEVAELQDRLNQPLDAAAPR